MDDNFDDYFTNDAPEEQPQAHQETEQEREEREIKEATIERRGNTLKILLVLTIVAMVAFLGWWMWQHYFHPYRTSQEKGWIMQISNEGAVFKTYEGRLIQAGYNSENAKGTIQSNEFEFSVDDDNVADQLMRSTGKMVELHYKEYKGALPWRGMSKFVVDSIISTTSKEIPLNVPIF